ncbi:MAG: beta-L-arabinofuranosidase domain-containing protein [Bryobacteraceae bacterium]|jgi:hypothetical protein
MKAVLLFALGFSVPLLAQSTPDPRLAVLGKKLQVAQSAAIKGQPAFVPLPVGAVVPKGWLRDWALNAANGITGHLDEYSATFGESWKAHGFEARGAKPDGTGWPLEQGSYWLDGAVRLAYILDDKKLIEKVTKRLDLVVDGVLKGGDSFVYWRPESVLADNFNNWAHSHMGRALVAYYQATGDERILKALVRVYRHYPLPQLPSNFEDVCGAVNVDAMLETYLMSGDETILKKLTAFSSAPTYRGTASTWLSGNVPPGHNVIFYENIRVPALAYAWTGDKRDLGATEKAIEWNDRNNLLPYGISSGEEYHAGIGATRNTETCNVTASFWTYLWMLRNTGDGAYSDRMERIFLNAAAAPVSRDFKTMCYYQSPNRYSTALPAEEPREPGPKSYQFTKLGHSVLCCVGNLNRVIPNYIMYMWMATPDKGLAATLYGPSRVRATAGDDVKVEIDADTIYPFEVSIQMTVRPERPVAFPLYLRIPSWCHAPEIRVNGRLQTIAAQPKSLLRVFRTWEANDKVELRFPMQVQIVRGRETPYPRIPYFVGNRKLAQKTAIDSPYASIYYGPLLFALPIEDETPNQEKAGGKFNYALDVSGPEPEKRVKVLHHPMPEQWNWPLAAPVELVIQVREFDWMPTELQPLPGQPVAAGKAAEVKLVPYGCTKFRVSMFPIATGDGGQ